MEIIDIALVCINYFFEMWEKHNGFISAIVGIAALIIARQAINTTTKDNRQQVLVSKYEEIYELVSSTVVEYELLQNLYAKLQQCHSKQNELESLVFDFFDEYRDELTRIKSVIDTDELFNKLIRLNVLSNAYLDEPLLFEVNAYSSLFQEILITTVQLQFITEETDFKEGFPTNEELYKFTQNIAHQLIKKISLGTKTIDTVKFENYLQSDFKKTIGLK